MGTSSRTVTARVARLVLAASLVLGGVVLPAQQQGGAAGPRRVGVPVAPIGDGPWTLDTAEQHRLKVNIVTKALANPWSLAFLPDGSILVTERAGRLRIVRNGVLDPQPVAGAPEARQQRLGGLMDVVLHPKFAENRWVYLTYSKAGAPGLIATALARGTWNGTRLVDTRDLFVATPWWDGNGGAASRLAFGRDGMLYMTTGASVANMQDAQEPGHH